MKKRNATAFGLALAMTVGLAAPAWAAEEKELVLPEAGNDYVVLHTGEELPAAGEQAEADYLTLEEFVEQYMEEHPEHYEEFDAEAWYQEWYGDWWPKEEYMEMWGVESEEDFKQAVWQDYLMYGPWNDKITDRYNAYLLEFYESRHPGELDSLETEELLARRGYTETLTPAEQFMWDWGLDSEEEVRTTLLNYYVNNRLAVEAIHTLFLTYRESYPEEWAAFDAEAYLGEEHPWYTKEEYMGDYSQSEEEFVESMFTEYVDNNRWKWETGNDWGYNRELGLVVNGDRQEASHLVAVDGVSYLPADEVNGIFGTGYTEELVPLRSAAEAAGWDILWNSNSDEIVLLDREKLMKGTVLFGDREVEQDLSGLDKLMNRALEAAQTKAGQSYRMTERCDITLTAFNSLDGDETYKARVTAEMLSRDGIYNMTVTVQAADLLRMLSDEVRTALAADMDKLTFQNLKTLLDGVKMEVIMNAPEGKIYVNAPILANFVDGVSEDTWAAFELGETGLDTEQMSWNTGEFLYGQLLETSENHWSAAYAYSNWVESVGVVHTLFGPHAVTEKNGTLTWKADEESMAAVLGAAAGYVGSGEDAEEWAKLFREFEVQVSIDKNGRTTSDAVYRLDMDAVGALMADRGWNNGSAAEIALYQWVMNLFDFRMEAHTSGTVNKSSGTTQFQWKNQFRLEMQEESGRTTTNDKPVSAPPEGTEIVEA